jgi:Phage tail protein
MTVTQVATIARSSVPTYPYIFPQSPDWSALGLQAVVQFNGLNINDRLRPDRYLLTKITGMGQADIRDTRIPNPSEHGEKAYDAFYSGTTMTFEGKIQAGSLFECQRMERDLRAALGPLVEFPIKFNWFDIHDDFSDALTSEAFWTPIGAELYFPGDGTMRFAEEGLAYYSLRRYVDSRIGCKLVIGSPTGPTSVGIASSMLDSENYIKIAVSASSSNVFTVRLMSVIENAEIELATPVTITTPISGQSIWLVLQQIDDVVLGNAYSVDPTMNPSVSAIASLSATLAGAAAAEFGYQQTGMAGIDVKGNPGKWVLEDYRVDSVWPGDVYMSARPISPLAPQRSRENTRTGMFETPFQFALRASNPRILSPVLLAASMGTIIQPELGRIYPRTFPTYYTVPINEHGVIASPTSEQQSICSNKGNWLAQPIFTIHGEILNPTIVNLTTGEELKLNCTISASDYLVVNCGEHTIQNSKGSNQFGVFNPESKWIKFFPGDNLIIMTATSSSSSALCTIQWQHTWI